MKRNLTLLFLVFITLLSVEAQEIIWEKSIGGEKSEYLHDIKPTPDYGFILAGSSLSGKSGNKNDNSKGDLDYYLSKVSESGIEEWQKTLGGSGEDILYSVNLTSEGGYILGGVSNSPKSGDKKHENIGGKDFWVIKLNPLGEEEWQFTMGGLGNDILLSIQQTRDKGYILGGTSESPKGENADKNPYEKSEDSRGSMDFWIVKLSERGKVEWQRTIGGTYYDLLRSVHQTLDGGYILGGYSNSPKSGEKQGKSYGNGDFWIVKLTAEGKIEWQKMFGKEGEDDFRTIIPTKDKGYLLGGTSEVKQNNLVLRVANIDWWIIKLDKRGNKEWEQTFDIGKKDRLISITESSKGEYLLAGYAGEEVQNQSKEGIEDYFVIKINENGEKQWQKSVGGKSSDRLQGVVKSRDGAYILAGTSNSGAEKDKGSENQGREDFWIIKLLDKDTELQINSQKLELYPNPARDYVNIIVHEEFKEAKLQVIDMLGALVLERRIRHRMTPLEIKQLQTGAYIIKVVTENSTYTQKLLKR